MHAGAAGFAKNQLLGSRLLTCCICSLIGILAMSLINKQSKSWHYGCLYNTAGLPAISMMQSCLPASVHLLTGRCKSANGELWCMQCRTLAQAGEQARAAILHAGAAEALVDLAYHDDSSACVTAAALAMLSLAQSPAAQHSLIVAGSTRYHPTHCNTNFAKPLLFCMLSSLLLLSNMQG